ncbi:MAG: TlpA disulfide reductase family protein, partial [Planctomycetota bacterium]
PESNLIREIAVEARQTYLAEVDAWATNSLSTFQPIQFDFSAAGVDGGTLEKSKFEGRITVVDLWATWCPPCREGLPHFIRLNNEYSAQGVEVIGLSVDNTEDPASSVDAVRRVMQEENVNYPCAMADQQIADQLTGQVQWPTTVFIDASGEVRLVVKGFHDYEHLSAVVEKLLEEE